LTLGIFIAPTREFGFLAGSANTLNSMLLSSSSIPIISNGIRISGRSTPPILKFLGAAVTQSIIDKVDAKTGDIIFFGADKIKIVNEALGNLREKIAKRHKC
jgi:aspartyl-tRNA synthetase